MKQYKLTILAGFLLCGTGFLSCSRQPGQQKSSIAIPTELPWSQRMAVTIMHDFPDLWKTEDAETINWAYTKGLACDAFIALWKESGDRRYFNYAKAWADTMINDEGTIYGYEMEEYNIDKINSGKMLFDLFAETRDPRYEIAIQTLRQQLVNHPRTEAGGFWHKQIYPIRCGWMDCIWEDLFVPGMALPTMIRKLWMKQ